jgi:hypothetical protein
MLRLFVLLLVLLNGVYFAWGQGWLLPYGWGPATQREPQRLAQQVRPEALRLQRTGASAPDTQSAPATPVVPPTPENLCLQSVALEVAQATELRGVLQAALPAEAWAMESLGAPSRWLVYMGKYADAAEVAKKRVQLAALGLKLYPLGNAALAPGLSLGSHATQEKADAALAALKDRGVRTARVLEVAPATSAYRLRLQGTADTLKKPLAEIEALLADKPLVACPPPAAPVPE